jgi:hypothetical protein
MYCMYVEMHVLFFTYEIFGFVGLCVHVLDVRVSECFLQWNSELVYWVPSERLYELN